MYGTNVLTAPRTPGTADVVAADHSFRIRHSRPSAGYEVPLQRASAPARAARPAPRLRLTKRGRAVLAGLAALPVAIALFAMSLNGSGAVATTDLSTGDFDYVTVLAGQTLWQLAGDIDPNADPRDVIYDVLQLNQLTSSQIHPGQRLAIPAAYSNNN